MTFSETSCCIFLLFVCDFRLLFLHFGGLVLYGTNYRSYCTSFFYFLEDIRFVSPGRKKLTYLLTTFCFAIQASPEANSQQLWLWLCHLKEVLPQSYVPTTRLQGVVKQGFCAFPFHDTLPKNYLLLNCVIIHKMPRKNQSFSLLARL